MGIRDAQVQEKVHLKQELESEDTRLDTMGEIDRVNAIKQQEQVEKNRNAQRVRGAKQIMDQIEANSLEKMLATERREQEAKLLVENQRKLQMLDLDEIETKKKQNEKQKPSRNSLNYAAKKNSKSPNSEPPRKERPTSKPKKTRSAQNVTKKPPNANTEENSVKNKPKNSAWNPKCKKHAKNKSALSDTSWRCKLHEKEPNSIKVC